MSETGLLNIGTGNPALTIAENIYLQMAMIEVLYKGNLWPMIAQFRQSLRAFLIKFDDSKFDALKRRREDGTTYLHIACKYDDLELIKIILDPLDNNQKYEVLAIQDKEHQNPFYLACCYAVQATVEHFFQLPVPILLELVRSVKFENMKTPLHHRALGTKYEDPSILEQLLRFVIENFEPEGKSYKVVMSGWARILTGPEFWFLYTQDRVGVSWSHLKSWAAIVTHQN